MRDLLTGMDYTVQIACSAQDGLRDLQSFFCSLILIGADVPEQDVFDFLQKIKQDYKNVEVLLIKNFYDQQFAVQGLRLGAADCLVNPINREYLGLVLEKLEEKISLKRQVDTYTSNLEELAQEKTKEIIKLERKALLGQIVEGLSEEIRNLTEAVDGSTGCFNELPCFVSIHNEYVEIIATNQLYKDRLGKKVGCHSWEIYKGRGGGAGDCPVAKTLATGKGQRGEEIVVTREGEEVPVLVHTAPISIKDGDVELVLEISVDITQVKRLQDKLLFTQQRYQQLFDEVPCYISVQDMDLRIAETNNLFKRDFGDYIGSYCYEVYMHRDKPCPGCLAFETFEDGNCYQSETVITSRSGEQYNVLVSTAPIKDANEETVQVMVMSTNITEIRRLQDHLTSLGMLLGSVSHGVKGLLTGLDGGIYRLESALRKDDKAKSQEALEVVKQTVGRIRRMVLNILYYAKSRELQVEELDLHSFVQDVVQPIKSKAQRSEIELICDFESSLGKMEADPHTLSSALVNFLENAIEACESREKQADRKVLFKVSGYEKYVFFEISDTGVGMDQETKDKLFTLFFSSKGAKGTGLGLYIAKQVIDQHGGHIEVQSDPGEGTSFEIFLPRIMPNAVKNPQCPQG